MYTYFMNAMYKRSTAMCPEAICCPTKKEEQLAERERIQTRIDEKIIKYTDSDKFLVIEFVTNVTQYH